MAARASIAASSSPPISTRSGVSRSPIAVPSARNSGLESTEKRLGGRSPASWRAWASPWAAARIAFTASAVRTGRVLFSTTIVWPRRSGPPAGPRPRSSAGRWPLAPPRPRVLVGVFTREEHHVRRRDRLVPTAVLKCRLRPRARPPPHRSGFVHRQPPQIGVVPGRDPLGVQVHHRHLQVGAAIGDHRHGGPPHVARPDAADGAESRGGHQGDLRCAEIRAPARCFAGHPRQQGGGDLLQGQRQVQGLAAGSAGPGAGPSVAPGPAAPPPPPAPPPRRPPGDPPGGTAWRRPRAGVKLDRQAAPSQLPAEPQGHPAAPSPRFTTYTCGAAVVSSSPLACWSSSTAAPDPGPQPIAGVGAPPSCSTSPS